MALSITREVHVKRAFEVTTNALVAIVAVLLLYQFLSQRVNGPHQVAAGDHLPAIEGVSWGDHESALLLVMRKGCHFCEDSMPFYRRLAALRDGHQTGAYMVAAFPDSAEDARGVIEQEKLDIPYVANVAGSRVNATGTPTLILVDRRGVVRQVWIGELQPDAEASVIKALKPTGT